MVISAVNSFSYLCSNSHRKTQKLCPLLYAIRNILNWKKNYPISKLHILSPFSQISWRKKDIRYFTTHTHKYTYASQSYHNWKQQLTIQRPSMTSRCSLWSRISCFHRFLVAVLKKSGNTTCPLGHTFE